MDNLITAKCAHSLAEESLQLKYSKDVERILQVLDDQITKAARVGEYNFCYEFNKNVVPWAAKKIADELKEAGFSVVYVPFGHSSCYENGSNQPAILYISWENIK